jgi:hypothetical protein
VNLAESPGPAAPFLRIISSPKCLKGTYGAVEKSSVLVSAGDSWNEAHRTYLYDTFPTKTPVESVDPIPPKGRQVAKSEGIYTDWGKGWTSTSGKAQEQEFSNFLVSLINLNRPKTIIETGIGDGLTTRKLVAAAKSIGALYTAFEHDEQYRKTAKVCGCVVSNLPTPSADQMANADLVILDSMTSYREKEIELWLEYGRAGSTMVVHDVSARHRADQIHRRLFNFIQERGIHGAYLHNPRGGFIATKPDLPEKDPVKKPFFQDVLYLP